MNFNRSIRHTIYEILNFDFIDTNFIVDTDLRSSGLSVNKSSFMNLEITFYIKNINDFKSPIIKDFVKTIIDLIDSENFKNNKNFVFNLTKTNKTKVNNIYL
jgi:predicted Zn-dependent protease